MPLPQLLTPFPFVGASLLAADGGGLAQRLENPCGEPDASRVCEWFLDQTGVEWLAALVGQLVEPLFEAVIVVAMALLATRLVRRAIRHAVTEMKDDVPAHHKFVVRGRKPRLADFEGVRRVSARRAQRADALGALGNSVAAAVIWTTATFMVLGAFGLNLGPLIASAGIVGVAIGFGSQSLVRDFLSGVFMLVEDQYGVGDIVDVGEASGVVEGVGLRTTRIRSVDGTLWHVPNGEIRRVGNMSQEWARALLDISVAYDTDIERAQAIIKEVADAMWQEEDNAGLFLAEPEVWGVEMLGADGIDIRLVIKTKPGEQWAIGRELRRRIKARFDAERIEIPFPQRTVWHRNAEEVPGPAASPPKKRTAKKATKRTGKKATKRSS